MRACMGAHACRLRNFMSCMAGTCAIHRRRACCCMQSAPLTGRAVEQRRSKGVKGSHLSSLRTGLPPLRARGHSSAQEAPPRQRPALLGQAAAGARAAAVSARHQSRSCGWPCSARRAADQRASCLFCLPNRCRRRACLLVCCDLRCRGDKERNARSCFALNTRSIVTSVVIAAVSMSM
jgi:hypothetical protein